MLSRYDSILSDTLLVLSEGQLYRNELQKCPALALYHFLTAVNLHFN